MHDHRLAQARGQLQLAGEDLFLALPAVLEAELAECNHARIVEIVRKTLQQIVDSMPGDSRRMQRERHHRLDSSLLQAGGLDPDQLVPVPAQVERAAGARVAGARHRRFHAEVRQRSQVLVRDPVGMQMEIEEHRRDGNMWHGLGRRRSTA